MSETDFGKLSSIKKKVYSAKVLSQGRDNSFFFSKEGFISKGLKDATKPIHFVDELTRKGGGDRAVMPLVLDLVDDGVAGDNNVENNEEDMEVDSIEITIDQLRHGVKSKGKMSEQRTVLNFRALAKDRLANWWSQKVDEMLFLMASGVAFTKKLDGSTRSGTSQLPTLGFAASVTAPTSGRILYAGTATGTGSLTTADKMTWNLIIKARALAERKNLKPIMIDGMMTYIIVMSTEQGRDLRQDSDYKTIVSNAGPRGKANELFKGAFCYVDGLVLYQHNKVYNTLGLTSGVDKWGVGMNVDGAQALLMGAQALGWAAIEDPEWGESDNKDYGNKQGVAYGQQIGAVKAAFKSIFDSSSTQDFAIISIYTAAAA